jgi:hypothetical protein
MSVAVQRRIEREEAIRPLGAAVAATIGVGQAILGAVSALALIVWHDSEVLLDRIEVSRVTVLDYALVALTLAAITLVVAIALWRAVHWARALMALVEVAQLAAGAYLVLVWEGVYVSSGVLQILVASLALWLLYGRADRFFARRDVSLPSAGET